MTEHVWNRAALHWENVGRGELRIVAAQDCLTCGVTRLENAVICAATLESVPSLFGMPRWTCYRERGSEVLEMKEPTCGGGDARSLAARQLGGVARAKKLSPAERTAIARKAALARWHR